MSKLIDEDKSHSNLIYKIAIKYNMNYHRAKRIVTVQQRYTAKEMAIDRISHIKWPRLGKFKSKVEKFKRYLENRRLNGTLKG